MVDEFPQAQVPGEGGRQEQAGIGHQAVIVKGDADTVGIVLWQHLLGAPSFRAGFCSKTIIPDSREHPPAASRAVPKAVHRWIRVKLWFDAARFTYNRTIELLTSDGAPKASWLKIKKDILTQLPQWTKPVPYEVKSHAIRDACLAVSAVKKFNKQLKIDRAKGIRLQEDYAHFRSRRDDSQTIFIHSSAISVKGVYHTLLGNLKLREPIPHAHGDAKLTLRHHQYHLSVPFKRMGPHISESNLRSQAPEQVRVVALDPGVRNFITWFSEDGCGELGQEDFGRIQRLC